MKAYVIKNKDNKVLCWDNAYGRDYFDHFNLASINRIQFFRDYRGAEVEININDICDKNCEVVEITIVEGDLEQEIAEKDKEIEELKASLDLCLNPEEFIMGIRKQVCDEISDYINKNAYEVGTKEYGNTYVVNINEILDFIQEIDKIEKGE